jgi:ABC-type amino acid transport substrate-binding protein
MRAFLHALLVLATLVPVPTAAQTLEVAVPHDPPYAIHDPAGVTTGLAVDLMRLTAEAAGLSIRFTPWEGPPAAALDEFDLLVPVSATPELAAAADMSLPLHTATLGVARDNAGLWNTVLGVLSIDFLRVLGSVALLLLFVGALVWLLERRRNSDQFDPKPLRGLGDGFWWAGVTLTTIGYGDKAPATVAGRAVAMLWMLMGLAVSASLTATIVAATNVGGGAPDLPEDLRGERVAVVAGGPAARFAEGREFELVELPDMAAVVSAVADGEVDAGLGAAPALRRADAIAGTGLKVDTTEWEPVLKVALLPEGDDAVEGLDRALLTVLTSAAGQEAVRRWLGE